MFVLYEHVGHSREKHSDQHLCSLCNGILSLSLNRSGSNTRDHSLLAFERKQLEPYLESLPSQFEDSAKGSVLSNHCFAMLAKLCNIKGTVLRVKGWLHKPRMLRPCTSQEWPAVRTGPGLAPGRRPLSPWHTLPGKSTFVHLSPWIPLYQLTRWFMLKCDL